MRDLEHNLLVVVDILASNYGWTIEYIQSLDLGEILKLLRLIKNRTKGKDNLNDNEVIEDNGDDGLEELRKLGIVQ